MKRGSEKILHGLGARRFALRRNAPLTVVLAYHNVVPEGERRCGDLSLHIGQRRFAEHLDRLTETHDVVPLDEAFQPRPGGHARPRAVVTFDDAYLGAVTAGLDELRARGLPATIFVCPGLLGSEGFWWDRLAPGGRPLSEAVRAHALEELAGRQEDVLSWAAAEGLPIAELPAHARPASADVLAAATARGDVSLGSHTWGHPNVTRIPPGALRDEIARTARWLADSSAPVVGWLAFPYGIHDPASVAEAEDACEGAFRIDGGLAERRGRWPADRFRTPRINVPAGLSADGLALRVAGIGPR